MQEKIEKCVKLYIFGYFKSKFSDLEISLETLETHQISHICFTPLFPFKEKKWDGSISSSVLKGYKKCKK